MRNRVQDVAQAIAIGCLAVVFSMIVHKGYLDVSALAAKHSGGDFWVAVARYLLANLASG